MLHDTLVMQTVVECKVELLFPGIRVRYAKNCYQAAAPTSQAVTSNYLGYPESLFRHINSSETNLYWNVIYARAGAASAGAAGHALGWF